MTPTRVALDNEVVDTRDGTSRPWSDLVGEARSRPTAWVAASSVDALPAVASLATHGGELLVVARSRLDPALREQLLALGLAFDGAEQAEPADRRPVDDGRVWLLTSGSTGRPKQIAHTLDSLTTVRGDQAPRRWLCPYSPGTYAWWQVVTLGLTQPGQDLVVVDPSDLDSWVEHAVAHRVTAASGTPTFWRQTIMREGDRLAEVPLEQVSLGGEPVDQAVLDQLRDLFPDARISWLYASSELGASIVVHDGRAGFPQEWLGRSAPGRPLLEVDGDELVITSPHHGEGLAGRVRTGDRVVVEDGRVRIVGRVDRDEINVGGTKVSAGTVRDVLQRHPDVAWASVRGRKAPLVGAMVVADVVAAPGREIDDAALRRWATENLPETAVPRRVRVLPEIPAKETLKSDV
ncbi:AMP-binding protein [Solicola sp. PLA-1-18]|uniref:AMP-binding protein n=1 Tax=Solicola sp. PLA-1-18 TaxID=3380532 RepID=UPI003B75F83A